jgi:DNA-directed RNA polymerase subunit RPC12/RpoP
MHKTIKVCPDCESTVIRKDKGSSTEYAVCSECKRELFLDELKDKTETICSYILENGKRIYFKQNERIINQQSATLKRRNAIKRRAQGLSYRDRNTLKRLRK